MVDEFFGIKHKPFRLHYELIDGWFRSSSLDRMGNTLREATHFASYHAQNHSTDDTKLPYRCKGLLL
jgi:hypothetical protein